MFQIQCIQFSITSLSMNTIILATTKLLIVIHYLLLSTLIRNNQNTNISLHSAFTAKCQNINVRLDHSYYHNLNNTLFSINADMTYVNQSPPTPSTHNRLVCFACESSTFSCAYIHIQTTSTVINEL